MSGIFGLFHRDGRPVDPSCLETMRKAMADWGPDRGGVWFGDSIGLGQLSFYNTPESPWEPVPGKEEGGEVLFVVAARLDNRADWLKECGCSDRQATISDGHLLRMAYRLHGERCLSRLYGDWAMAVWHPTEKKLFLARDPHGNTSLYYYVDDRTFAFSSSRQALLCLNLAPLRMDEFFLAQLLISWTACHGERTIHAPIRRLPPAHFLVCTQDRLNTVRYWRLENIRELRLPHPADYVTAFLEVYQEAVRCRLRVPEMLGRDGVAVTLSGGLDSGSVAVTAASLLQKEGKRLQAFTSVPLDPGHLGFGEYIGNEWPLAQATARSCGNIDLHPVTAAGISPIRAIREALLIHQEPIHTAGNCYWLNALKENARACGCSILLTGQLGNLGISWTGEFTSHPWLVQIRHLGWRGWMRSATRDFLPTPLMRYWRRHKALTLKSWRGMSAIHPDFARRLQLWEQRIEDTLSPRRPSPLEQRLALLQPGASYTGALHAAAAAAFGLDVRDPTGDIRVLEFTFSMPDHLFIDPKAGMDRWLIRTAMQDRLPDQVRLNRRMGIQSADLTRRLRVHAAEVEETLGQIKRGPAAEYVDEAHMRRVWERIRSEDTIRTYQEAVTILTRGIMAGLFVNQFSSIRGE